MGVLVNTNEAKTHLRLNDECEDLYVDAAINAAESYVSTYLNRPLDPWTDDSPPEEAPLAVKQAILMVVADMYENREAQSEKQYYQNPAVQNILHFHRLDIGV